MPILLVFAALVVLTQASDYQPPDALVQFELSGKLQTVYLQQASFGPDLVRCSRWLRGRASLTHACLVRSLMLLLIQLRLA
jgi:hypothetical protein